MTFRDRLLATLRAVQPILEVPGVIVVGSEVPNLLEADAASSLVVSQDVDLGIPVAEHAAVKRRLSSIDGLVPSAEEPSVWVPRADRMNDLIEVNFLGLDPSIRSNLGVLLLLPARAGMPDPGPHRARLAGLAARLEAV